jgi:hypothetical protein
LTFSGGEPTVNARCKKHEHFGGELPAKTLQGLRLPLVVERLWQKLDGFQSLIVFLGGLYSPGILGLLIPPWQLYGVRWIIVISACICLSVLVFLFGLVLFMVGDKNR